MDEKKEEEIYSALEASSKALASFKRMRRLAYADTEKGVSYLDLQNESQALHTKYKNDLDNMELYYADIALSRMSLADKLTYKHNLHSRPVLKLLEKASTKKFGGPSLDLGQEINSFMSPAINQVDIPISNEEFNTIRKRYALNGMGSINIEAAVRKRVYDFLKQ